jgi:hypothetical protein
MAVEQLEAEQVELDKPLEDLSEEELQQMLDDSQDGQPEQSEPSEEVEDVVAETDDDSEEPTIDEDAKEEIAKEDSADDMLKAMRKEMDGLQKMFARSQTELGEYRKLAETIQDLKQSKESEDEEVDLYTDPDKYLDRRDAIKQKQDAAAKQAETLRLRETKDYVESIVPDFENMIDDISGHIGDMFKGDDKVNDYVNNFKANPYILDSLTLAFAGKAAQLGRRVAELEGKVSSSDEGKNELIRKVKNLGKTKSAIGRGSNSSTNGRAKSEFSNKKIEGMSIEELEKLYMAQTDN